MAARYPRYRVILREIGHAALLPVQLRELWREQCGITQGTRQEHDMRVVLRVLFDLVGRGEHAITSA
ncbi:MAG: hypothetical protein AAF653_09860 [Chloroflexota bacterium]